MNRNRLYRYPVVDLAEHERSLEINGRAEEAVRSLMGILGGAVMVWLAFSSQSIVTTLLGGVGYLALVTVALAATFGGTNLLIEDRDELGQLRYWLVANNQRSELSYVDVPRYQGQTIFAHSY